MRGFHEIPPYSRKSSISCIQRSSFLDAYLRVTEMFFRGYLHERCARPFRGRWRPKSTNENFVHLLHVDNKICQEIVRRPTRRILMHAGKGTYRSPDSIIPEVWEVRVSRAISNMWFHAHVSRDTLAGNPSFVFDCKLCLELNFKFGTWRVNVR